MIVFVYLIHLKLYLECNSKIICLIQHLKLPSNILFTYQNFYLNIIGEVCEILNTVSRAIEPDWYERFVPEGGGVGLISY